MRRISASTQRTLTHRTLEAREDDTFSPLHDEEDEDEVEDAARTTKMTRRHRRERVRHEEDLAEGTLMSHLVELRSRLFKTLGSVFLVFICLLPFCRKYSISSPRR